MISSIHYTDGKLYMVDEEGNEHEVTGGIDLGTLELFNPTPYDPFEELCDSVKEIEEKKEGINMELLKLYNKKSRENINKYYDKLIEEERENDVVQKAFNELIDTFNKDLENLSKVYNPFNKVNGTYIEEDDEDDELYIPYSIVHETTEKEQEINNMRCDEIRNLDEKIEEINAHFQLMPSVETSSHEQAMEVLKVYGVVDENGKLTPYTPVEPKKVGRPKKETE